MKKTYTFVLAVFCGLFVFSFFGKYNHFANLLSSFYVQFVWLATVLGICLLVAKLYRHAAVAALILLLSVAKIAYAFLPAEVAVTGKQPLKIIQFNVNYANSKPQEIVKWINEKQPDVDIVVFQEVTSQLSTELLKLETGYTSAVFFPGGGAFGSLIVSKPPFRAARRKNIKGSKIKYSEIELRNGTKIYEIHTLPPAGSVLAADRDTSLAYMANIIAADAAKNKILVGDLNITPYTYQFSRLEQTSQLTNSMRGFKQLRGTWPTMYNIVNRIPIDHLLVSKNISVVDREIGPDLGSDHFPVMTRLLISE